MVGEKKARESVQQGQRDGQQADHEALTSGVTVHPGFPGPP